MIKYIGQHIVDFIARFRSDVYLEDIADGTVASDKFLGLDSNNKIVKETVSASSATLASTVTVTDSTASAAFPVVFHDESNALLDDTAAFTYNPSNGNLNVPGDLTGLVSGIFSIAANGTTDVALTSKGNMGFAMDADNNETGQQFGWYANSVHGSQKIMSLAEDATLQVGDFFSPGTVVVHNQVDDDNSGELKFQKQRGSTPAAGQDNDIVGTTRYLSYNDAGTPEAIYYAAVQGSIADASDTDEAGKYEIKVACSDGSTSGLQTAFSATGSTPIGSQTEIDVNIGHGEFSKTNIAGSMTIGGAQSQGDSFNITANSPTTSGQNGALFSVQGSDGNGTNKTGGDIKIMSGASTGSGEGGRVFLSGTPPGASGDSANNSTNRFTFYTGNTTPYLEIGPTTLGVRSFIDFNTETFENTIQIGGDARHCTLLKYAPAGTQSSLAAGQIYFLQTNGSWAQADASATSTGATQLLAVIAAGGSLPNKGIVLEGFIRIPSTEILNTPGSGAVDGLPVYVSTTSGHFDFTAPSGNDEYVRCVGYAIDDHSGDVLVYFKPDNTFVRITA